MHVLGTMQELSIGHEWTGVDPDVAARRSNGMDLHEASTQGGRVVLPSNCWSRINTIAARLDGAVHGAAGSVGTVTLLMAGVPYVLEGALSNEDDWLWRGGPIVVPPRSVVTMAFAPGGISTILQYFTIVHEPYRSVDRNGLIS